MGRRGLSLILVLVGIGLAARHARPVPAAEMSHRRVMLESQMHPVLLKAISMDLDHAVAAVKWLESQLVVGDSYLRRDFRGPQKTWLFKSLRSQIYLDPYGLDTYYMAGGIFTFQAPVYPHFAANLLLYGAMHRTEDWRIVMSLGHLLYREYRNEAQAEVVWELGSKMEGTPKWLPGLVAMLKVQRNELAEAELVLRTMLGDDKHRGDNPFMDDMKKMQHAIADVKVLHDLAKTYASRYGEVLPSLQKLVDLGVLRFIPRDPWDIPYQWDPQEGRAHASQKLTPFLEPKGTYTLPEMWLSPTVAHDLLSLQWGVIN